MFSIQKDKRSDRRLNKPWISLGLLKSEKKNKLYKQYLFNPSNHREVHYKRYKNMLNHSLRVAKHLYYDKKFEESKPNVKAIRRLLSEVINRPKEKSKLNSTLMSNRPKISLGGMRNEKIENPQTFPEDRSR